MKEDLYVSIIAGLVGGVVFSLLFSILTFFFLLILFGLGDLFIWILKGSVSNFGIEWGVFIRVLIFTLIGGFIYGFIHEFRRY